MIRTKLAAGVALVGVLVGAFSAVTPNAFADAPTPVGPHRHYILVADEKVYVGPNFCDVDASAQGFYGFHHKVHLTDPGMVDVKSEGC